MKLTHAQFYGLLSLAMSPSDLQEHEPHEFGEFSDIVRTMKADAKEGLRLVLKRAAGLEWDKVQRAFSFGVEQFVLECQIQRHFGGVLRKFKDVEKDYLYIQAHKQMTNLDHDQGSDVMQRLEQAKKNILNAIEESLEVEAS